MDMPHQTSRWDADIRFAIAHRRIVRLRYHAKTREAEPHDYGVMHDRPRLLIYQRRELDDVSAKRTEGWRLLDVAKIEDLKLTDETFPGSRAASHEDHFSWDVVYARVR